MSHARVVIVAPNWLGDAVMALPAVADLRAHFAGATFAVAARPQVAPLFDMVQGVDSVITLPGRGGVAVLTSWRADVAALTAGSFDTAVLLPNSFVSAFIAARAAIGDRWGFATDWRGRYLTRAVPKARGLLHQSAYYQALVSALGVTTGPRHARVIADRGQAEPVLHAAGIASGSPFVVLAPGAAYGRAKQWLPERFAELAGMVTAQLGWHVVLVGSKADASVCAEIAARLPPSASRLPAVIDLSGRTDLHQLAGVLASSRAVVANDSGAMHLAGAVGARVLAVFGATNEARTSPLTSGPDAPSSTILTHEVFCRPCMLRECPIDHRCMSGITAARVFATLAQDLKTSVSNP